MFHFCFGQSVLAIRQQSKFLFFFLQVMEFPSQTVKNDS